MKALEMGRGRSLAGTGHGGLSFGRFFTWMRVAQERRRLAELDPRLLEDMGISPEDARREAARPFWDVNSVR